MGKYRKSVFHLVAKSVIIPSSAPFWLVMPILLISFYPLSAQQNVDAIIQEIEVIEDKEPNKADVKRIIQLASVLEDSAVYGELPRLFQLALSKSRLLHYDYGVGLALTKLANEYSLMGSYQQAASYCDSLLARTAPSDSLRKVALLIRGTAFSVLGEFSKAINSLEEALTIPVSLDDELEIYDYLSYSYSGLGNYDQAIQASFTALDLLKVTQPEGYRHFSQFYHNLGLIHLKNSEYRKAIRYYQTALNYNLEYQEKGDPEESIDNVIGFAISKSIPLYLEIGQVYKNLQMTDSAIYSFLKAKELDKQVGPRNREIRRASIGISLANIYCDLKNYELAHKELIPLEEYFAGKLSDYTEHVRFLISKGITLKGLGRSGESLEILLAAKTKAEELSVEDEEIISNLYASIANGYESIGDFEQSLFYFKALKTHEDSIYNSEKTRIVKELEEKYLASEKEKRLAQMEKKEVKLNDQLTLTFLGIVFLLILSGLLFRFYKVKQRDNRLLENRNVEIEQKRKEIEELSHYKQELLTGQLQHKERELTVLAMNAHEKNDFLVTLKKRLEDHEKDEKVDFKKMKKEIDGQLESDQNWNKFLKHFEQVHPDFFTKLKDNFPNLTNNDLKLSAYIRIGMSNKELASLVGIDHHSARNAIYRLKKKLDLAADQDLRDFINSYW